MTIDAAIELYRRHLIARGYTSRTCEGYVRALEFFARWAAQRDVSHVAGLDAPLLRSYQDALVHHVGARGTVLKMTTQAFRLQVVRQFLDLLVSRGLILVNLARHIPLPRIPPRPLLYDLPTVREVERILEAPNTRTPTGVRDRAVLELLYATGLRRSELVALGVGDVDVAGGTVTVRRGKGNKGRVVPLGPVACQWVGRYLTRVRGQWAPRGRMSQRALFLGRRGTPLCGRAFLRALKTYARKAGVKKRLYLHLLRHACATHMLERGADLRSLQLLLGHERLATVAVYTHLDIANLKRVHRRCHPRAADGEPPAAEVERGQPARRPDQDPLD